MNRFEDFDIVSWLIGAAIAAVFVVAVVAMIRNQEEWERFSATHECKVVGKMTGDVFNTVSVGGNGQVSVGVGSTPSKTGYACNDGVTYWR